MIALHDDPVLGPWLAECAALMPHCASSIPASIDPDELSPRDCVYAETLFNGQALTNLAWRNPLIDLDEIAL